MLNRVVLVGRLTRDPELRHTATQKSVATFSIAVNRNFTNQQGEREADFINIVVWGRQADNVSRYVGKGSLVGIDGRIQTRNYQAQDGSRRYVTEVVAESVQFLDSKSSSPRSNNQSFEHVQDMYGTSPIQQNKSTNVEKTDPFGDFGSTIDISDDDLPF